jgi:hypothetical protein
VVLVVDDLLGWLVGLVADAGRKKLVTLVLGTDQERALRRAAEAAVEATAVQLAPPGEQADQLATAVGDAFRGRRGVALAGQGTLLEALQAGVAERLAMLDDPDGTGTGRSSLVLLEVPSGVLAQTLAGHLVHEITVRGAQGGPLTPLAGQLNHDMTHLQGQRLEGMLAQVIDLVTALAQSGYGPQVPRKPVRLAPRPEMLAGREELLAEVDATLAGDGDAGPQMVALCGLGGAGKTSMAVEYAHRHLPELEVAWQFAAEDPAVLAAGFGDLAAELGARRLADARDPVASVHAVLAKQAASWLLVFDNVPDRASVLGFLPPAGRGRVLITCRNPAWPPGQLLEVPALATEVAADFLTKRTGDPDRGSAVELAGQLGGLPLALEQAAAYLQATGTGLADYLLLFRRRRGELLTRGEPTGYSGTVATAWRLAFDLLEQSEPQAAALLRLLAFCAPEEIPLQILLQPRPQLAGRLGASVTPALAPLLDDPLAANDAVAALRRYSLITPTGGGSVSVHRLVQAVTADQMPPDLAQQWKQAAAMLVEAAIPDDTGSPQTWPMCAALLPHAQGILADDSHGMAQLANYLGRAGRYGPALELQRRVIAAQEQSLGAEHPRTLSAREDLAQWTGDAGDPAAARDLRAALLPIRERVLGAEHPDTLDTRQSLAWWTGAAGDPAAARDQLATLLPIRERVLGAEHPRTLATRRDLARWTSYAGDPAAARDQCAALLPVIERVLGASSDFVQEIRGGLAESTGQAGDPAAARDQYAALLPDFERVLGAEHPDTLAIRGSLAGWTGRAGDAAGARDQYAALLPDFERVLGAEHPDTLTTRDNLAYWTKQSGGDAGG